MFEIGSRFSRACLLSILGTLTVSALTAAPLLAQPIKSKSDATMPGATIPGVRLTQSSGIYGERLLFTFCPKGFKLTNLETGITTSACAPDWTVHIINPETKRYYDVPLARYEGYMLRMSVIFWGFSFPRVPFVEGQPKDLLGMHCRLFRMKKLDKFERAKIGISAVHSAILLTTSTKDLPYSPETLQFVRRHFNFPNLGDLPVSMRIQHKANRLVYMLSTSKIEKVPVDLSGFKVPKGMKKALNDKDVLRGNAENGGVDSLLKEIDRSAL